MPVINKLLADYRVILILYLALAIGAATQSALLPGKTYTEGGPVYTHYNNYVIFKQAHFHFMEGKDLYQPYPEEHWDLYKYSPAFALCFGVFARLPDAIALALWNSLNALVLLFAVYFLPRLDARSKGLILVTVAIELMTSMQHQQTNPMITGLIILAFGLLERKRYLFATLCIVLTVFIKIFGVVAFVLFLFYPRKWKLTMYSALWMVALAALPLIAISFSQLQFLYSSWLNLLMHDHDVSYGFSVMGWLHTWFHFEPNKAVVLLSGAALFVLPLLQIKKYSDYSFRLMTVASLLLWVVIFNHRAESPSFIIAMTGVAIWFYSQVSSKRNLILILFAFVFTSLITTDIFPAYIRSNFMEPYMVKAFPSILLWLVVVYEMTFNKIQPRLNAD